MLTIELKLSTHKYKSYENADGDGAGDHGNTSSLAYLINNQTQTITYHTVSKPGLLFHFSPTLECSNNDKCSLLVSRYLT